MVSRAERMPEATQSPGAKSLGKPPVFALQPFPYVQSLHSVLPANLSDRLLKRVLTRWLQSQFPNLKGTQKSRYRRFGRCLWYVRTVLMPKYLRTYVPEDIIAAHELLSIEHCRRDRFIDPLTLIKEARFQHSRNRDIKRRAHFALCDLEDALLMLWLTSDDRHPFMKKGYKLIVERDQRQVLDFLRLLGLISGTPREVTLQTVHNRRTPYECLGIFLEGENEPFVTPTSNQAAKHRLAHHLRVELATENGPIPALLVVRRKGIMQTLAKLETTGVGNPNAVPDRRGIRFLFRNKKEMEKSAAFILERLPNRQSLKWHVEPNDTPINPHADPNLPLIKVTTWIGNKLIEIQWMLAKDHVDLRFSHGRKNTLLYHMRSLTSQGGRLRVYRPTELFDIDWDNPRLQRALELHILASIST